jgi:hypothetical protein
VPQKNSSPRSDQKIHMQFHGCGSTCQTR